MLIDVRLDMKGGKLVLINSDGSIDEVGLNPPYFYALLTDRQYRVVSRALATEDVSLEEDSKIPIIYSKKEDRYVTDPNYRAYRVVCASPNQVPRIAETLSSLGMRIAAHNVRYIIRNVLDRNLPILGVEPIYFGFDSSVLKRISEVEGLVIDIEVVESKPVLASVLVYRPFMEVRHDMVESLELPKEMDRLQKLISKYPVIYGHNILGFDIPVLRRAGFLIPRETKLLFDTSYVLSTYSASLGVGAARSLLDVATVMAEEVGITQEELEIIRRL